MLNAGFRIYVPSFEVFLKNSKVKLKKLSSNFKAEFLVA
jgi:hypothetical protein